MHSEATRRVSRYTQAAAAAIADADEAVLAVAVAEVVEAGAEEEVLAVQMAVHENERGKIKTRRVGETIIGREDMIRRWRGLGRVLDRLLSFCAIFAGGVVIQFVRLV
jgi:hypothetical protein